MRTTVFFLLLLISSGVFCSDFKVSTQSIYPPISSIIARNVVSDVKSYYSGQKLIKSCVPKVDFKNDETQIELIKNESIKEVRVEYFSEENILLTLIFIDDKEEVALDAILKNSECIEFMLYKSQRWVDPK